MDAQTNFQVLKGTVNGIGQALPVQLPLDFEGAEQHLTLQAASQQLPRWLMELVMPYTLSTSLKTSVAYCHYEKHPGALAGLAPDPGHAQHVNDEV